MPITNRLVIQPARVTYYLFLIATSLSIGHLCIVYLRRVHDHDYVFGLSPLLDFAQEGNFPSYFSALLLMMAAILLAVLAKSNVESIRKHRSDWLVLSVLFVFLSCDELIALHERLMFPTRQALNTSGLLYAAWLIPYGIALLGLAAYYFRWFLRLRSETRWRFFTAAALFLTGAILLEAVSGAVMEIHQSRTLLLDVFIFFEDVFEMSGAIMFIWALLLELSNQRTCMIFETITFD